LPDFFRLISAQPISRQRKKTGFKKRPRSRDKVQERQPSQVITVGTSHQQEIDMKNAILAATCAAAFTAFTTVGAMAQTTGPTAQDSTKMGTEKGMSKDGMSKNSMSKDGMKTQGMSKDSMSKDGMKKDKSQENKPVGGMKK
jgi:pentapeptide MXKDX repeat protein